jgi:hypothetical protein
VSEREEAGQQQQYCPSCRAESKPGDAFCASCGTRLIQEYEKEDPRREGASTTDAPSKPSTGILSGDALRGLPENLLQRFKGLPIALKVAGVIVVVVLLLLILFSPVALVAAMLLLGVSVVAAIKGRQGRSAKMWRTVAVAAFVLTFAFAGVYDALYGEGALGGADGETAAGSTFEDYSNASCLNEIHPDTAPSRYEIVDSKTSETESGATSADLVVAMNIRGNMWATIGELREETAGYDSVRINTYPPNLARYDRARNKIVPGPLARTGDLEVVIRWRIVNSAAGEASLDSPKGELNACGTSYESGGYRWGGSE